MAVPVISWFDNATRKHLRLPFSFHLMPVFLFALSQAEKVNWFDAVGAFLILHLLIYPASNGYNSFQDRDVTSIGGLKNPPPVSRNLFYATLLLDIIGIISSAFVNLWFLSFVALYVVISRAYSYRGLRLKKYPVAGFLTVFIFQGAFTYLMSALAFEDIAEGQLLNSDRLLCMLVASLFIGSVYPLTQIYQHEADKNDGVTTISFLLGYRGTFAFSAILFSIAVLLLMEYFTIHHQRFSFFLFVILMTPVVLKLGGWFLKVRKDPAFASYERTMSMNLLASSCMNFYFLLLILNNQFGWF